MTEPRNPLADVETATIVRPGDRLIVTMRADTSAQRIADTAAALKEQLPGVDHVLLSDADVTVVPAEPAVVPASPAPRKFWEPDPLPADLDALPVDDPLVVALGKRINAKRPLVFAQTIGGVVAALRELRPNGLYDPNDKALLDAAAVRIGYTAGGMRLHIVELVINALNAETVEVAS